GDSWKGEELIGDGGDESHEVTPSYASGGKGSTGRWT
ncbi:hypothetical protein A2U01_0096673, partial [Trifolium medium]|nr:hypothetical protein [Trifolium medium]